MKRKILFLLIVICVTFKSSVVLAEEKFPSGIKYNEIENVINNYINENKNTTVGLSVSIYDKDKTIYQNNFGYTNKEKNLSVNDESVFEWGSTSKLFIWISVMQLEEQDKIDLEEDIREYLPKKFLKNITYKDKITMLDLMNHQAGFQEVYAGIQTLNESEVISLYDALSKNQPKQIFKPGTVTAYSNWSSSLAAYIVENVSGMDYVDYVHENIFKKLDMNHTSIGAKLEDNSWVKEKWNALNYYDLDGNKLKNNKTYIIFYPSGMGIGTMDDFLKLAKAITPGNKCVLFDSDDTLNKMYTATSYYGKSNVPNNYHGFWASQYGIETLGHGGNTFGSSAMIQFDPKTGIGMVVFTNQAHEQIYNYKMYELIFGSFKESKLSKIKRDVPKGLIKSARTIERGPFSILSSVGVLSFTDEDLDSWWYQDDNYIYGGYSDDFICNGKIITSIILVLLLVVAGVYSLITIIFGLGLSSVIKLIKKKQINFKQRKWNYITNGVISAIFVDIIYMFMRLSKGTLNGKIGSTLSYEIQSILILIFSILLILLLIRKIFNKEKYKINKPTFMFSIIVLINVIVFELYAFWLI